MTTTTTTTTNNNNNNNNNNNPGSRLPVAVSAENHASVTDIGPMPGPSCEGASKPPSQARPSLYQMCLLLVACTCYLMLGMSVSWSNTLVSHLAVDNATFLGTHLNPSPSWLDWLGSSLYIAMSVMMIPAAWVVAKVGRRRGIIIGSALSILSWLTQALAVNFEMIILGRMIYGASICISTLSCRPYVTEIASNSIRGTMLSLIEVMRTLGYTGVALLTMATTWFHICFIGAACSLIYIIIVLLKFPESPTLLVTRGRKEEAREILVRLRGSRSDIDNEVKEMELMNQREDGRKGWMALLSKDLLKSLLILTGLFIIVALSGIPMMTVSITRLLQAGLPSLNASFITVIAMAGYFFGSLTLIVVVDRIGRRWCLRISLSLMAVVYAVLGTLSYLDNPSVQVQLLPSVANASDVRYNTEESSVGSEFWSASEMVTIFCIIAATFCGSVSLPVLLMLSMEYFPTTSRSQAMSIVNTVYNLVGFVTLQLYSTMESSLSLSGVYWCYGGSCAVGVVAAVLFVRETSNKSVG